jgi:hypothetical protein
MRTIIAILTFAFALAWADDAFGQRRGGGGRGGGGGFARGGARSSIHSRPSMRSGSHRSMARRPNVDARPSRPNVSRPSQLPSNRGNRTNIDRNNLVNRDVDINRDINIGDVDINNGRWGNGYWDNGWNGCCHYHPLARAAVGTAAAYAGAYAATAAVGSYVYTLPAGCVTVIEDGITYEQCGSTWYQPTFYGTNTAYYVVEPPR